MKTITVFLLLLCINFTAFSQSEITISGRLIATDTETDVAFATVVLKKDTISGLLTGTITEDDGRFVLELNQRGNFIVQCSFIGYETLTVPILVGSVNNIYDLGKIYLNPESTQLAEVTVSAQKAVVDAGLSKKSFDIENQIAQAGGSVSDALKALPGVAVDQDGNVLLRGSDKVAVLIDGKQSGMTGFGSQKGLSNIPAANIERIEIINNPSAKYDAAGMAGIINIIYKKEVKTGFNGSVGFTYGLGALTERKAALPTELGAYRFTPKYLPSVSLNYRKEKVNTFLQAEVLRQRKLPNNEFTTRNYADGRNTISQVPENRKQTHYVVKTGIDYELSPENTLNFSALFDYEKHIDTAQVAYIDLNNDNERYRYWHWRESEITGLINFRLNYEHKFSQPGHKINFAGQYTRGWEDESYFLNDSSTVRKAVDMTRLIAKENTTQFNADYVKPLKSGRVELGSKVQFRTLPVTYEVSRGLNSIIYEGLGDYSNWGENIYAAYVNYIWEKQYFTIEGGLRAEQTEVFYDVAPENIYYPTNDAYNYFELFPNVRLTGKINEYNNVSLFYNRRIDRPGEPELRVFPKYDDPELLKVGNPYLRPQLTQTVEAAYKRIWNTGSAFVSAYYRKIDDPFTRVFSIDNSDPTYQIINRIYQNTGGGSNIGTEILLSQTIKKNWKVSSSLNIYQNVIDAYSADLLFPTVRPFSIERSEDTTWDLKINNQFSISDAWQVQLTGVYFAPKNIPQGRQLERSSVDLGVQRSILKNKGSLTLSFSDMFGTFGIRQEIADAGFTAIYENYYETQVVRLGLKYKW